MSIVSEEHIKQFHKDGFFVLEKVISADQLAALCKECNTFMEAADARFYNSQNKPKPTLTQEQQELIHACKSVAVLRTPFKLEDVQQKRPSTTVEELKAHPDIVSLPRDLFGLDNPIGITHPGKRYPYSSKFLESQVLRDFLFGSITKSICQALLGDAYLFLEQFVVKGPEVGMKFGWHQDSGYIPYSHEPYVTLWIALDDMSEANGTIYAIPFSNNESCRAFLPHAKESGSNDMVCFGAEVGVEKGVAMNIPAGSIVVFSSLTPHCSGANKTPNLRRAYIVQFSHHPICAPELNAPRHFAERL